MVLYGKLYSILVSQCYATTAPHIFAIMSVVNHHMFNTSDIMHVVGLL